MTLLLLSVCSYSESLASRAALGDWFVQRPVSHHARWGPVRPIAELVDNCRDGEYATKSFVRLESVIVWIPPLAGLYGCHSPAARTSARHASSNEQVGSDA